MGMKTIIMMLVILSLAFTLVGCNTVKGVGRDVERVGEEVEDVVD